MDYLTRELGVVPTPIKSVPRDPGPGDLTALWTLVRIMRRDRPQIVHTHAAKGGDTRAACDADRGSARVATDRSWSTRFTVVC